MYLFSEVILGGSGCVVTVLLLLCAGSLMLKRTCSVILRSSGMAAKIKSYFTI